MRIDYVTVSTFALLAAGCASVPSESPMSDAAALTEARPATTVAPVTPTTSPLLAEWTGPYGGVPPWDQVRPELFPAAFQQGVDLRRREIQAIANNPAPPTFANTIVPLQDAGSTLR